MLCSIKKRLSQIPAAVHLKLRVENILGVSLTSKAQSYEHLEIVDRNCLAEKMVNYWTSELEVGERTARDWLSAAFNFDRYIFDVAIIKERFGSLAGKRIADIGCGWGSFLLLLEREGAMVEACDIVPIHVEVSQFRVPTAKVRQADARNLEGFADESFDIVLEHDVFEHVGDYQGDTGPIGRTHSDKLKNLKEIRRILKPGGRGFLSTGNYNFPYNGEVHAWFLHWFPYEYQQRYLKSLGLDSDRYWLCTWEQIVELFDAAGLRIDEVYTPPHDVQSMKNIILDFMKADYRINEEFGKILGELMNENPKFMPTWMIFFTKV